MRTNIGFRISSRRVHLCFKPIQSSKLHLPQAIKTKFVDYDDAEWRHAKLNGWHPLVVSVPEGGPKAFHDDTRKKVTKFWPKGGKFERIQRRRGRERIESATRPVLGIRKGEKNRSGRLTKEALIAAGSRERTSKLKSSLFFSFCLLIRPFSLSLSLSLFLPFSFFSFYLSAFPRSFLSSPAFSTSFSRTLWNRLSESCARSSRPYKFRRARPRRRMTSNVSYIRATDDKVCECEDHLVVPHSQPFSTWIPARRWS